jgi:hypothetical protein
LNFFFEKQFMYRVGRTNKQAKRIIITKDHPPPPPPQSLQLLNWGGGNISLSLSLPLPTSPHTSIQVSPKFRFDKKQLLPKANVSFETKSFAQTMHPSLHRPLDQRPIRSKPVIKILPWCRPSRHTSIQVQPKFRFDKNKLLPKVNIPFEPSPSHKKFTHPLVGRFTEGQLGASRP